MSIKTSEIKLEVEGNPLNAYLASTSSVAFLVGAQAFFQTGL